MPSLTATAARKDFFEIVKDATEKHATYHIHHRKGDVVLMAESEYTSLIETLELLSAPGFKERFEQAQQEVERGDTVSFDDVFGESL
ncbi:MAG: prevent-host-death protein [Desulfobacteraceae bacterium 4572_35.1]|nr:MAG: prevent-host-death protein [Desulfobacteraceae bacterium 4572_35.1]